jgi:hypothetical protein
MMLFYLMLFVLLILHTLDGRPFLFSETGAHSFFVGLESVAAVVVVQWKNTLLSEKARQSFSYFHLGLCKIGEQQTLFLFEVYSTL